MQSEGQFTLLCLSSNLKIWAFEIQGQLSNKEDMDAKFHASKLLYE